MSLNTRHSPQAWRTRLGACAIAVCMTMTALAQGQGTARLLTQANALYAAGQYVDALGAYDVLAENHPDVAAAHLGVAAAAGELRQYAMAAAAFTRALPLLPTDAALRGRLADAYRANRQFDAAERWYEEAISLGAARPSERWHVGLALVELARGRAATAVAHCDRAIEINPASRLARHTLGTTLLRLGRLDAASAALGRALSIDPVRADTHFALGQVATRRGDHAEALTRYTGAVELDATRPAYHYALAQAALRTGTQHAALQSLALYRATKAQQYREKAADYRRAEQWAAAAGLLRDALDLDPTAIEAAHEHAYCLLRMGELSAARAAYTRILSGDVYSPPAEFYMAVTEHRLGDSAAAETRLRGVIELAPDFADGYWQLAVVREAMGNLAGAETALDAGLARNEDWAPGYRWRGLVRQGRGDTRGAEDDFRRAIQLAPDTPYPYESLARLLANEGSDLTEALSHARHAVELTPTPTHLATLALVYHLLGQVGPASDAVGDALRQAPNDAYVTSISDRLGRATPR